MPILLNESDVVIALALSGIGRYAGHRSRAWWNYDDCPWFRSARLNSTVDWFAVIGAIGHHARNLSLDLLEQDWHLAGIMSIVASQHTRGDLTGIRIESQMQFAPGPACPSGPL